MPRTKVTVARGGRSSRTTRGPQATMASQLVSASGSASTRPRRAPSLFGPRKDPENELIYANLTIGRLREETEERYQLRLRAVEVYRAYNISRSEDGRGPASVSTFITESLRTPDNVYQRGFHILQTYVSLSTHVPLKQFDYTRGHTPPPRVRGPTGTAAADAATVPVPGPVTVATDSLLSRDSLLLPDSPTFVSLTEEQRAYHLGPMSLYTPLLVARLPSETEAQHAARLAAVREYAKWNTRRSMLHTSTHSTIPYAAGTVGQFVAAVTMGNLPRVSEAGAAASRLLFAFTETGSRSESTVPGVGPPSTVTAATPPAAVTTAASAPVEAGGLADAAAASVPGPAVSSESTPGPAAPTAATSATTVTPVQSAAARALNLRTAEERKSTSRYAPPIPGAIVPPLVVSTGVASGPTLPKPRGGGRVKASLMYRQAGGTVPNCYGSDSLGPVDDTALLADLPLLSPSVGSASLIETQSSTEATTEFFGGLSCPPGVSAMDYAEHLTDMPGFFESPTMLHLPPGPGVSVLGSPEHCAPTVRDVPPSMLPIPSSSPLPVSMPVLVPSPPSGQTLPPGAGPECNVSASIAAKDSEGSGSQLGPVASSDMAAEMITDQPVRVYHSLCGSTAEGSVFVTSGVCPPTSCELSLGRHSTRATWECDSAGCVGNLQSPPSVTSSTAASPPPVRGLERPCEELHYHCEHGLGLCVECVAANQPASASRTSSSMAAIGLASRVRVIKLRPGSTFQHEYDAYGRESLPRSEASQFSDSRSSRPGATPWKYRLRSIVRVYQPGGSDYPAGTRFAVRCQWFDALTQAYHSDGLYSKIKPEDYAVLSRLFLRDQLNVTHSLTCSYCGVGARSYWFCDSTHMTNGAVCHHSLCHVCYSRCLYPREHTLIGLHTFAATPSDRRGSPPSSTPSALAPPSSCTSFPTSLTQTLSIPGADLSHVLLPFTVLIYPGFTVPPLVTLTGSGAVVEAQRSLKEHTYLLRSDIHSQGYGCYPLTCRWSANTLVSTVNNSVLKRAALVADIHSFRLVIDLRCHQTPDGYEFTGVTFNAGGILSQLVAPVLHAFAESRGFFHPHLPITANDVVVLFNCCDARPLTWKTLLEQMRRECPVPFTLMVFQRPLLIMDSEQSLAALLARWTNRLHVHEDPRTILQIGLARAFAESYRPVLFTTTATGVTVGTLFGLPLLGDTASHLGSVPRPGGVSVTGPSQALVPGGSPSVTVAAYAPTLVPVCPPTSAIATPLVMPAPSSVSSTTRLPLLLGAPPTVSLSDRHGVAQGLLALQQRVPRPADSGTVRRPSTGGATSTTPQVPGPVVSGSNALPLVSPPDPSSAPDSETPPSASSESADRESVNSDTELDLDGQVTDAGADGNMYSTIQYSTFRRSALLAYLTSWSHEQKVAFLRRGQRVSSRLALLNEQLPIAFRYCKDAAPRPPTVLASAVRTYVSVSDAYPSAAFFSNPRSYSVRACWSAFSSHMTSNSVLPSHTEGTRQ
jgi:hypothetical protein